MPEENQPSVNDGSSTPPTTNSAEQPTAVSPANSQIQTSPAVTVSKVDFLNMLKNKRILLIGGGMGVLVMLLLGLLVLMRGGSNGSGTPTPTPSVSGTPVASQGKIAFLRGAEVFVFDLATQQEQNIGHLPLLEGSPNLELEQTAWSSDGRLLTFILRDPETGVGRVQVIKISDGVVLDVLVTSGQDPVYAYGWIPDSLDVIISYAETQAQAGTNVQKYYLGKLSVLGFPGTKRFLDWVRPIITIQVSEDGFIYFLDEAHELWRVPLAGGQFLPVLRNVASFEVSPDGRQIVYERVADGEIWVSNENGTNPKQITFSTEERKETYGKGGRSNPRWAPDNRTLLFSESGANYRGIGLVQEDGSGLRSVEENDISPRIKYNEFFNRALVDLQWVSDERIVFVGATDDENVPSNLYLLNVADGSYQEIVQDVNEAVWSKL